MYTLVNKVIAARQDRPLDKLIDAKVIATSLTALIVGWIVAFAARKGVVLGETDIPLVWALVGPPIYALAQGAIGWWKRDPRVQGLLDFYRRNGVEPPELGEPTDR